MLFSLLMPLMALQMRLMMLLPPLLMPNHDTLAPLGAACAKVICAKVATATQGKMHQHTNTFLDTSWLFATHGDPLGHILGV